MGSSRNCSKPYKKLTGDKRRVLELWALRFKIIKLRHKYGYYGNKNNEGEGEDEERRDAQDG